MGQCPEVSRTWPRDWELGRRTLCPPLPVLVCSLKLCSSCEISVVLSSSGPSNHHRTLARQDRSTALRPLSCPPLPSPPPLDRGRPPRLPPTPSSSIPLSLPSPSPSPSTPRRQRLAPRVSDLHRCEGPLSSGPPLLSAFSTRASLASVVPLALSPIPRHVVAAPSTG